MGYNLSTYRVEDLIEGRVLEVGDGYRAKNSELGDSGVPFARAANINDGFHFQGADRFPDERLSQVGNKLSRSGDVVFTSKGTVGRFAFVSDGIEPFLYSPQLCFWRSLNVQRIVPRFLFYWMQSDQCLNQIDYLKGQTDMADYVSLRDQRRMTITLPDPVTQSEIATTLAVLDDKITVLRETNTTLEAVAHAIFKSWFVDFDPVRAKAEGSDPEGMPPEVADLFPSEFEDSELGAIPRGWRRVPFGDLLAHAIGGDWGKDEVDEQHTVLAAIIRGTDMPDIKTGAITGVPRRFVTPKKLQSRLLKDGDIAIEVSGGSKTQPTGRSLYITEELLSGFDIPVAPTSFCRLFRGESPEMGLMLAMHLASIYAAGKMWNYQVQSTGLANFQTTHFLQAEHVVVPCKKVQEAFYRLVRPLIQRQHTSEIRGLADLRDTLLPRLMSGKLRIPVDDLVEMSS